MVIQLLTLFAATWQNKVARTLSVIPFQKYGHISSLMVNQLLLLHIPCSKQYLHTTRPLGHPCCTQDTPLPEANNLVTSSRRRVHP